jgi:hypothetical protein
MKPNWMLYFGLALSLAACGGKDDASKSLGEGASASQPKGLQLMTQYCGSCHSLPSPQDLDKKTWKDHILVRMGAYMGIYNDNIRYFDTVPEKWQEPGIGGQRARAAGIYPSKPLLSRPDWEALRDYIIQQAPQSTAGPAGMAAITQELPNFKAIPLHPDATLQPLVTALAVDSLHGFIYTAFFQQSILELNGSDKKVHNRIDGLYGPIYLDPLSDGFSMAEIGSMRGSDHPKGSIAHANNFAALKAGKYLHRWDSLMRPVMVKWADLDQDGDHDAVIAEFGYHMGELSWQENLGPDQWKRHTLFPDDGTVSIHLADFTGDGQPDILSLKANADERVDLYVNDGHGNFTAKMLFRFNPTYGCTALEVVDWDRDGRLDFLVANGDNGDYPPILKANHGIRLYLNQGNAGFKEAHHWPFNGAYGMKVRDFDQDGDWDLAAVSFYPDYKARPEEAFIYFEQTGKMEFKARTFPEYKLGRWMVMDAADIDHDGDQDILLGAFDVKNSDCSEATYDQWIKDDVPVLVLENQTTKPTQFSVPKPIE